MTAAEFLKTFDLTPQDGRMILIGTVVFFLFWRIADVLIFRPFLALYEEREALTTGASHSSRDLLEKAAVIRARTEEQVNTARLSAVARKLEVLSAAKQEAAKVTEAAETEVQEAVRKARWEREQNLSQTRERVLSEAETLAREVVGKLTATSADAN